VIGSRRSAGHQRAAAQQAKLAAVAEDNAARGVAYAALIDRIVAARRAVVGDPRHPGSWTEQRAAHRLLTSLLGDAVTTAFAADASGASCPPGIAGWAGEGLARSTERETAIFAALDVG
jgi:hypothetical protein